MGVSLITVPECVLASEAWGRTHVPALHLLCRTTQLYREAASELEPLDMWETPMCMRSSISWHVCEGSHRLSHAGHHHL